MSRMRTGILIPILVLSVLLSATLTRSESDAEAVDEHVHVLTDKTFDQFISENEFTVVFFYAPWCGHCVRMKPFYHEAAKLLQEDSAFKADKTIQLTKVDATVEQTLANRFDLDGYPTLKIIRKGTPYDYEGPRQDGAAIAKYLVKEASDDWKPPVSLVSVLTESNFTEWVEKYEISLVEFYAPSCVHCKRLAPHFEKAAKILYEADPIPLAKVDASVELELSRKYNVQGYPTLYIFRKGRHYEYKGGRESHEIVSFMKKARTSQSKEVHTFNQFTSHVVKPTDTYILGLFENAESNLFAIYNDFASKYPDDFNIFHSFKPDEFSKYFGKPKVPSIIVYYHDIVPTKKEPKYRVLDDSDASVSQIEEFVMRDALPLVGHLSEKNKKLIYDKVNPVCFVFYDVDAELKSHIIYVRDKVAPIASQFKKIKFVIANETENAGLIKDFHLEESNSETNVVCIDERSKKYIYDQEMDGLDQDEIIEFVKKFQSRKLKPFVRSQTAPKDNGKRLVKIVVGKTFEQIVHDKNKDVVLAFITPKSDDFEALYNKLAKKFSQHKDLVFAKFDFTQNDYPEEYQPQRAPILFFSPKDKKSTPVMFNAIDKDVQSLDELTQFVDENLETSKAAKEDL